MEITLRNMWSPTVSAILQYMHYMSTHGSPGTWSFHGSNLMHRSFLLERSRTYTRLEALWQPDASALKRMLRALVLYQFGACGKALLCLLICRMVSKHSLYRKRGTLMI